MFRDQTSLSVGLLDSILIASLGSVGDIVSSVLS